MAPTGGLKARLWHVLPVTLGSLMSVCLRVLIYKAGIIMAVLEGYVRAK